MINKSGKLLYLFDFDGTIAGSSRWKNLLFNSIDCYKSGAYINPSQFDIRWCILTGRPKIDKWFIRTFCHFHGLEPQVIFTLPTTFYHCKSDEEVFQFKEQFIKSVLDGKRKITYTPMPIEKVVYVDNHLQCTKYINSKRKEYRYIAISVADFFEQKIALNMV